MFAVGACLKNSELRVYNLTVYVLSLYSIINDGTLDLKLDLKFMYSK